MLRADIGLKGMLGLYFNLSEMNYTDGYLVSVCRDSFRKEGVVCALNRFLLRSFVQSNRLKQLNAVYIHLS